MQVTRIDYRIEGFEHQRGQVFYENRTPEEAIAIVQADAARYGQKWIITDWAWFSRWSPKTA